MADQSDLAELPSYLLEAARAEAIQAKHAFLGVEHVFVSLVRVTGGITERWMRSLGLDPKNVCDLIRREVGVGGAGGRSITPTPRLLAILRRPSAGISAKPISEETLLHNILVAPVIEYDGNF
jgi:ATP-dependent Clp protease ATP-binding subunit ClpA